MGFFKDFKRDFAQAVNELMPDKDELSGEYDDEDMVNTFDENDNMDIAPEDLIDDLEDFSIENTNRGYASKYEEEHNRTENLSSNELEAKDAIAEIPEAELINETNQQGDSLSEENLSYSGEDNPEDTVLSVEEVPEEAKDQNGDSIEDELNALESLDEINMEENLEDAFRQEAEGSMDELDGIVGKKVNISKDVSEAMMMREDLEDAKEASRENDDWEGSMSEIEKIKEEEMPESNIDSILSDDTTYITKGTVLTGSISTDGGIDIIGTVNGDVTCGGKLILGGEITGNVQAGELYANAAKITGEVVVEGSAKVGVGSIIVGNITATSAVVAGAVNGDIDVQGPVIVDSTAVIMGNIKSRTVQINNGAVIEGFCSQCYSEIDVKSFFE